MPANFVKWFYGAAYGIRAVWYSAHYAAAMKLAPKIEEPPAGKLPGWEIVCADLKRLLLLDLRNVKDGIYPAPEIVCTDLVRSARRSLSFFRDLGAVHRRRAARKADELLTTPLKERYPRYYLQNFHYQSGGYLTNQSADLYDHQVEVLFIGGADAMRRQALASLIRYLRQFEHCATKHLDVACGTGRFLKMLKQARPRQRVIGLDLSLPYLREASHLLKPWSRAALLHGNVEQLPLDDESFQIHNSFDSKKNGIVNLDRL